MIARWCVSTLIFTLTLFGVVSQQQIAVPNQEIVLQFSDVELTSHDVQHTIEVVKNQLLAAGGSHIKVKAQENGKLKISYYSDADVSSIKRAFSNEDYLSLSFTNNDTSSGDLPLEESGLKYNLDIYEIQSANNAGWDFEGNIVLQVETKSDRFLDPNTSISARDLEHLGSSSVYKTTYKVRAHVALTIGEDLHTIPEVRAGPLS
ncbi:hypothetical protein KO493_12135 [Tamlana agarivorans]|uniref:Uncharacterized protein n=1 Tax=Pseudotamlana agarivorans TaxID=481183 RepID=A0ACC5UAX0_9FLAO|nr:hypothetical protein [Tamlana agarivorans]MBU2951446.1 hypothetical protein [Tamlana agarivorans]